MEASPEAETGIPALVQKKMKKRTLIIIASIILSIVVVSAFLIFPHGHHIDGVPGQPIMVKESSPTNCTIRVVGYTTDMQPSGPVTNHYPKSEFKIHTTNASGIILVSGVSLEDMMSGVYYHGLCFMDVDSDNELCVDDYFILKLTIYTTGSTFAMTDSSDMSTYFSTTI